MNCPTRNPEPYGRLGHNQSPPRLDNDLTTNASENQVPGKSTQVAAPNSAGYAIDHDPEDIDDYGEERSIPLKRTSVSSSARSRDRMSGEGDDDDNDSNNEGDDGDIRTPFFSRPGRAKEHEKTLRERWSERWLHLKGVAAKYAKFIGPGIMVSVSYMDPGNYSTAVSAGALYQYKLLFVILVSNLFAVFLQTLCCKLGSVTGLDLAQNCREHLPRWLCITVYVLAEIAIIATDLAEVVGTAIALNILFGVPLTLGVAFTVIDVLLVLLVYKPNGPMKIIRYFEYMVAALVAVVVVCFAIELAKIGPTDTGAILRDFFLPSQELFESTGLYLSCGILGATVMPHSLYLGSGLVQPRLREYDTEHGYYEPEEETGDVIKYRPTIHAIRYAMGYSIAELIVSLFTVAIFVNAAILIVAGATLSSNSDDALDADLFSIYDMLKKFLGPAAGTVFALALLFSGQSAGIVCTLSGQMVSEGFLHWSFQPWIRRLITRGLAIAPCFVVAIFVGRRGLADVLNASQVVLSLMLPFVTAPLLYFTASKKIMRVPTVSDRVVTRRSSSTTLNRDTYTQLGQQTPEVDNNERDSIDESIVMPAYTDMSNSLATNIVAVSIFGLVSALNLFLIISMAMGEDVPL